MRQSLLPDFPDEQLLHPTRGSLHFLGGRASLSIEMSPFTIDKKDVEATLEFDLGIEVTSPTNLAKHHYDFPSNPEEGYVESSIYIWSVHNPIDLHSITFAQIDGQYITSTMEMTFVFEFEGAAKNLRMTFELALLIDA
jgi:hypothetical protein